jgi:hypothetical protein
LWRTKRRVKGISKNIVARNEKHDDVEGALPAAVFFNDEPFKHIFLVLFLIQAIVVEFIRVFRVLHDT